MGHKSHHGRTVERVIVAWPRREGAARNAQTTSRFLNAVNHPLGCRRPTLRRPHTKQRLSSLNVPSRSTRTKAIRMANRRIQEEQLVLCSQAEPSEGRHESSWPERPPPFSPLTFQDARPTWCGSHVDGAHLNAKRQADEYARALPYLAWLPPFILVCECRACIEVYADFSRVKERLYSVPGRAYLAAGQLP